MMNPIELSQQLSRVAFAFRGYNVTNLGRTAELLNHAFYGPIVAEHLTRASAVCAEIIRRPVDLVARVLAGQEAELDAYPEALALVISASEAQLACLEKGFGIEYRHGKLAYGYSLGEISAVAASSVIDWSEALRIPLTLASDCADLAAGVTLAILFSRGRMLPINAVKLLCLEINREGRGVIAISAKLSPNTVLLMGQGDTLDRFRDRMSSVLPEHAHLRKHSHVFPPLHTPLVWERSVPCRAGILMHTLKGTFNVPEPPVFSLVTGRADYSELTARDTLQRWTDHPQLLWNAIQETLSSGVEIVVHVGPDPNLIPATFKRLADNVSLATKGSFGMRAFHAVIRQTWLSAILPESAALLRAPLLQHIILEDWLLEQTPRG